MSDRRFTLFVVFVIICLGIAAVGIGYTIRERMILAQTPPPAPVTSPSDAASPAAAPTGPPPFSATTYEPMGLGAQSARVPVIMYHDIIPERGRGSVWFDCTVDEFRQQLDFLAAQGAQPITLEQLHRHLTRGESVPLNAVVLTFDDNYQGFYDNAYPLLKERNWPSAVFVHTNFVGQKDSAHPKMDWDTLRALDKEGLVTIASHTLSHPDDMAVLSREQQAKELRESKEILERELGHPVPYFAYPNGKGDELTFLLAQEAGYTMAFTIRNGPVEESPGIMALNRYIHTRLEKAWKDSQDAALYAPATVVERNLTQNPVILDVGEYDGIKLGLVRGGRPVSLRSKPGVRQSVGEFIQLHPGAVAGMNGTFFADAALRGTGNQMIGPVMTTSEAVFYREEAEYRLPRIVNRPLVLWGKSRIAIVPFQPGYMNNEEAVKAYMPDVTDVFLAGAWIVHDGVARTREEIAPYAARDFNDPRRRAFFGITDSGDIVLGGSLEVITTERLAQAAAAAGVREAVLMDSGFSTSIVYNNKIIVTGHTARHLPSRPVPHAIVVTGDLSLPTEPEVKAVLEKAEAAVGEISAQEAQAGAPGPSRRRRRR